MDVGAKHPIWSVIVALSMLIALPLCAQQGTVRGRVQLPDQAAVQAQGGNGERSDLNGDRSVDEQDLELFSREYLQEEAAAIDWCDFHQAATLNEQYLVQRTGHGRARFTRLLHFIARFYDCPQSSRAVDKSDLDEDGTVDLADLGIFSANYLDRHWELVDWCLFQESSVTGATFEGRRTRYYLQHFRLMLGFINDEFECDGPDAPPSALLLEHVPRYLVRMAGARGDVEDYYITDPLVGSLFIYAADLVLKGEIKGLDKPLGVAVDVQGNILVGNDGRDNVEVYSAASGELLAVLGEGQILMPTAITLDALGNIYVTDSLARNVKVFDPGYRLLRIIGRAGEGDGEFSFPIDTEVLAGTGEVFVADQGNNRIQIYDPEGNWVRNIAYYGKCSWFRCTSPPFRKLQALDVDASGRLHVLDNFVATVMVFDPSSGAFLGSYGQYGEAEGYLVVPLDLLISPAEQAVVTTGDGSRIAVLEIPW